MELVFDRTGGVFLLVDPDGEKPSIIGGKTEAEARATMAELGE
jgi:hypothetical protein